MVSVTEATQIIQSIRLSVNTVHLNLLEATGRVLAEDIPADQDFPPFHRVTMDGIAIHHQLFRKDHPFAIEGTQPAGLPRKKLNNLNNCLEVMTGAILPEGVDTVIRYEDVHIENGTALIKLEHLKPGMNIHTQGADAKKGMTLLIKGQRLTPAEIAVLASVGKANVLVYDSPRIAVVSSGDELVEITEQPEAHQVRRSNVYSLRAAIQDSGWRSDSHHLPDKKELVVEKLKTLLDHYDLMVLSGGVSQGKFDFIPETLTELGVTRLFHKVSQRPGKPFWFGHTPGKNVVFALPGNPVSTFLCFYRYIKPWIARQMGLQPPYSSAVLATDFEFQPELTYFLQVSVRHENGELIAYPIPGGGSGDFVNLKDADGFLELPPSQALFKAGEVYPYIPFR
jgi:molybdopterin molybdotransferase